MDAAPSVARAARWLWPAAIVVALGALGTAAYVIDALAGGRAFALDARLLRALRRPDDLAVPLGPAWLHQAAIDLSALGGFTLMWLLGAAALGFLALVRRWIEAGLVAASLIGASLANSGLKSLFHRARPAIVPHLAAVANASFPSGHAMISAAVYLSVGALVASAQPGRLVRVYVMAVASLLVVLIGTSRIYLGVHWPSDVLAGWCLGGAWAVAVVAASRRLRRVV